MFDWPWSGIHWLSGFIIGVILVFSLNITRQRKFWSIGLGLLILWELLEITLRYFDVHAHQSIALLKQAMGGFAFAPETTVNSIGDLIIGSVGLLVGRFFGRPRNTST